MADVAVPLAPAMGPASLPLFPEVSDSVRPILSRKRRMNFFDLANLLDSDGNLQNEMLVFAFAATMLSTIPVLLGNEFDVNVGLRRRRRDLPDVGDDDDDDPSESSYSYYMSADNDYSPGFFSSYTYKKIMTTPGGPKDIFHMHNDSSATPEDASRYPFQGTAVAEANMSELLRELLLWSKDKLKGKPLLPMLVNLALDRYHGHSNPADKLVKAAYKKLKNYW